MKGLYRGKYLIAAYDTDDFPVFIASTGREFINFCLKRYKGMPYNTPLKCLSRALKNNGVYYLQKLKIILIEADTVTHDCFEDADEDFINFNIKNRVKTYGEMAAEMDMSRTRLYRLRKAGLIKVNKYK